MSQVFRSRQLAPRSGAVIKVRLAGRSLEGLRRSLARLAENQNVSRRPIWPVLVDATPVILPKLGAVRVVTGLLYCGQLNALNASARTCSSVPPRRLNDFANERSTRRRPGPCTCEGFCVPGRIVAFVMG